MRISLLGEGGRLGRWGLRMPCTGSGLTSAFSAFFEILFLLNAVGKPSRVLKVFFVLSLLPDSLGVLNGRSLLGEPHGEVLLGF